MVADGKARPPAVAASADLEIGGDSVGTFTCESFWDICRKEI